MDRILNRLSKLLHEAGAGIVEYALAVGLIAVVSIGAIALVGERTLTEYECVSTEIEQPGLRKAVTDKITNNIALENHEKRFADSCI